MKYAYECEGCANRAVVERLMERRNDPLTCPDCKATMGRIFLAPQLITQREVDRPENKYAYGFSERDRLDKMKAEDIAYEKQWAGKTPSKPKKPVPFAEFAKKTGLI